MAAKEEKPDDFPIVDPHQHFWDLSRNYYPWLCDPKPVPFRYGDYSSLKRNYLPPDYLRDAGALGRGPQEPAYHLERGGLLGLLAMTTRDWDMGN